MGPNLVHHFLIIKSRLILDLIWRQTQIFVLEFEDSESMWTIVTSLRSSLSADVFLLAMMVLWKSWELRNMEVQNSPNDVPPDIVSWCSDYLKIFQAAIINMSLPAPPPPFPRKKTIIGNLLLPAW